MKEPDLLTILIVDDTPANLLVLKELLAKPDRKLLTADNGKDALKIALDKDVDLLLLDVQMPEMDGFEVAQILQSNKKTKDIPIIFVSATKKEHGSILKGFEEGAIDYLFKPLNPELTKAKVSVLLKIQRQRRELLEKNRSLEQADIQIKKLNAELEEHIGQLKALNHELEAFSYSVSHDLRAPLRAVTGYSRIFEEDYSPRLDDEGRRLLKKIQHNAGKMSHLIDDLLQFSKLGRKEVMKSEIDMEDLVRKISEEHNHGHAKKAEIIIHGMIPAKADPALITQVWVNLISNAIKYSANSENPRIEIGSEQKGKEIRYYIKDNGAGFDMNYAGKLFGVFQRLHDEKEFEGTGIGLAIVQRIISRHGGTVKAEGKVNEGATFYFTLPG